MHAYIHKYIHTYLNPYIHVRTYIYIYAHTYTHGSIYVYIYTYIYRERYAYAYLYIFTRVHLYISIILIRLFSTHARAFLMTFDVEMCSSESPFLGCRVLPGSVKDGGSASFQVLSMLQGFRNVRAPPVMTLRLWLWNLFLKRL